MHLFVIDLFISLDTVAPLIDGLNKKDQKTKICFVNPLQDFSNYKLISYLGKSKLNENYGTLCLGIKNKIYFLLLKIIMSLPIIVLKRLNKLWNFFYNNKISQLKSAALKIEEKKGTACFAVDFRQNNLISWLKSNGIDTKTKCKLFSFSPFAPSIKDFNNIYISTGEI